MTGDFEWHHEAAVFSRCYAHVGSKNDNEMCPFCLAGGPNYPFTDVGDSPAWATTLDASLPWSQTPPLNRVPFSTSRPASLYRCDPFHILKFGFFKDLAACILLELCWLGLFDFSVPGELKNITDRLQRAHALFRLWCLAEKKSPTIRKFSLSVLHRKRASRHPFLGGKGADSVLVLMFLGFYIRLRKPEISVPDTQRLLSAMLQTIDGGLTFTGMLQSHNIFMSAYCGRLMHQSGLRVLRGYTFLAARSIQQGTHLYALRPKLHYCHHLLIDLERQINGNQSHDGNQGHDGNQSPVLNPGLWNCESNEDWIGKVSRLSRKVSPRLISLRTIQRYLVAIRLTLKKHGL